VKNNNEYGSAYNLKKVKVCLTIQIGMYFLHLAIIKFKHKNRHFVKIKKKGAAPKSMMCICEISILKEELDQKKLNK